MSQWRSGEASRSKMAWGFVGTNWETVTIFLRGSWAGESDFGTCDMHTTLGERARDEFTATAP